MKRKFNPKVTKTILTEILSPQMTRSERSKLKIIDTVIACFSEATEDFLNYEQISRKGKLNRSLVNYYFPKKNDLLLTVIKYVRACHQELAVAEMEHAKTAESVFQKYIEANFLWIEKTPEQVKTWMLFWFLSSSSPELRVLHNSLTEMGEKRIVGILKQLNRTSSPLKKSDMTYLAKSIQRIITGAIIEAMTESTRSLQKLRSDTLKQCLDLLKIYDFSF